MRQPNFVRLETVGQFEEFNGGRTGNGGRTWENLGELPTWVMEYADKS